MGKPGEEGKEKEINLGKEGGGEGGTERDAKKIITIIIKCPT